MNRRPTDRRPARTPDGGKTLRKMTTTTTIVSSSDSRPTDSLKLNALAIFRPPSCPRPTSSRTPLGAGRTSRGRVSRGPPHVCSCLEMSRINPLSSVLWCRADGSIRWSVARPSARGAKLSYQGTSMKPTDHGGTLLESSFSLSSDRQFGRPLTWPRSLILAR